jgi:para-aminobenzoate synthetase / 4-amino-4-deoxychorismate lyase
MSRLGADHRPWARFDDLQTGSAMVFPVVRRTLVADRVEDVVPVLQEVERATEAGSWAFGFVAYEAAAALDPTLAVHSTAVGGLPLVWFGLTDKPVSARSLDALAPLTPPQAPLTGTSNGPPENGTGYTATWFRGWTAEGHHRDVLRVRESIARGETYQCNLTVRLRGQVEGDPLRMYRDLASAQRGAHNAYLDLGRFIISSASPELFFERTGDDLLLRPMKGTSPRGRTVADDRRKASALRASAKERAENVMIVDLIRNDVARVAQVGTVRVPELLRIERYETVLQLTSDVVAKLRPGVGLTELFSALFPSGSVTGAPKASTMTLIRQLESTPRGVYCGAVGFVGPPSADVRARFNVAIRTVLIDRDSGEAVYGTGGGITWSSDANAEHDEVIAKTAVLHHRPRTFELIETMRYDPSRGLRNRDLHMRRLADSAEHFGFRFDRVSVLRQVQAQLAWTGPARVRVALSRDGAITVDLAPLASRAGPVTLTIDDEPVDSTSPWLSHKTTLREIYERRQSRHPHVDDVVMINEREEVTEVTRANIALRLDGRWWTPPLRSGCLPGVERGRLIDRKKLLERVLHLDDLRRAEAIAVLSSLRGWRRATLTPDARNFRQGDDRRTAGGPNGGDGDGVASVSDAGVAALAPVTSMDTAPSVDQRGLDGGRSVARAGVGLSGRHHLGDHRSWRPGRA